MDIILKNNLELFKATLLTLELTFISLLFGIILGLFFAIMRLSKNKIIFNISYYYSFVFRGTPLLVQIFIIYFGLAQLEIIRESFVWAILKKPFWFT